MGRLRENFEGIFNNNKGRSKQISRSYREFSKKWSWQKVFYEIADEKATNFEKTAQLYLSTVLEYLCYLSDKAEAENAEHEFQSNLAKQRRGR